MFPSISFFNLVNGFPSLAISTPMVFSRFQKLQIGISECTASLTLQHVVIPGILQCNITLALSDYWHSLHHFNRRKFNNQHIYANEACHTLYSRFYGISYAGLHPSDTVMYMNLKVAFQQRGHHYTLCIQTRFSSMASLGRKCRDVSSITPRWGNRG